MAKRRPWLRRVTGVITNFLLALQWRVDDREVLIATLEVDAGNAEQAAKLVLGDPAPFRIDRPQRNMGEYDDRRGFRFSLEIILEPFKLLAAEIAEAAGL